MDIEFFDRNHPSELNYKYNHLEDIPLFISQTIDLTANSLYLSVIAVTFTYTDPYFGAPFVTMLLLQGLLEHSLDGMIEQRARQAEAAREPCHLLREEAFANIRTIKEFSCEEPHARRFAGLLADVQEARRLLSRLTSLRVGLGSAFWAVSMIIPTYAVIWRIVRGTGTAADLNTVTTYVFWFKISLGAFLGALAQLRGKLARLSPIVALMDRPPAVAATGGVPVDKATVRGEVSLRGVVFAYPARPDWPVLHGVTLTLEAGRTTALCGGSGGGKSTIAALVLRNYDPQALAHPPSLKAPNHPHTHMAPRSTKRAGSFKAWRLLMVLTTDLYSLRSSAPSPQPPSAAQPSAFPPDGYGP